MTFTSLSSGEGDGRTPLDPDQAAGLKLSYISTRGELADAEQRNILTAMRRRPPPLDRLLDDRYLRALHRAMFGAVWEWAGVYRKRELSIGIDPALVGIEVRNLVADTVTWIEHATFARDEIAVRFHHRLVVIHPFINGNGRHARLAADYVVMALGQPRFTWGGQRLLAADELRGSYLRALRRADRDPDDVDELVSFARG